MKTEYLVGIGIIALLFMGRLGSSVSQTESVAPSSAPPTIADLHPTWESRGTSTITFPVNPIYPYASGVEAPIEFYSEPTEWGSYEWYVIK